MLRMAFAGFRHGHILELYRLARERDDVSVVGACEGHGPTRDELAAGGRVELTCGDVDELFASVAFDALAVGDCYGRRGELLIRALEAGRHVISDKPICTRLSELDRIAELAAAGGLAVGCQLTMRDAGNFIALRRAVRDGRIGEVHTVDFQGQHPLARGSRPGWYFEAGMHGGTINDLAAHAMDMIPWATGRRIVEVVAARAWNARLAEVAFFQDAAQMMLRLDNGGGVLGDVSYLTPDSFAYKVPCYWRFTLHADGGLAETSATADGVTLWPAGAETPERVAPGAPRTGGHLQDFLDEVAGRPAAEGALTTSDVLAAARTALLAQKAADEGLRGMACA